jgi:hypothetical protein
MNKEASQNYNIAIEKFRVLIFNQLWIPSCQMLLVEMGIVSS